MHSRQQKLEVISGKLSAAGGVKINQTGGRRRVTIVRLKRTITRSKVSRQGTRQCEVDVQISTGASAERTGGFF
jgi:hypothetical protein